MLTQYTYDVLNNLRSVTQWGGPNSSPAANGPINRSFTYDSLSRLLKSFNPETGIVSYSYIASGLPCAGDVSLPCSKTDARGVTTTYTYDKLNRLLSKSYSDGTTPLSCYQYDTSSASCPLGNGYWVGRLTNAWTQSASTAPSCPTMAPSTGFLTKRSITCYDPMGRILNEQQFTPASQASGTPYSPAYTYDLAGNLTSSTTGVGPTPTTTPFLFTNTYDGAGRLQTVGSNWTTNYVTGATNVFPATLFSNPSYAAFGGLTNATYGNRLNLTRTYDNRLRITSENDQRGSGATASTPGSATVTITGSEQSQ